MSRSTKKPWYRDTYGTRRVTRVKRIQNRRYRRHVKQDLKRWQYMWVRFSIYWPCTICDCRDDDIMCPGLTDAVEPAYPHPHRFSNPYDVCDFRCYVDEQRFRRK